MGTLVDYYLIITKTFLAVRVKKTKFLHIWLDLEQFLGLNKNLFFTIFLVFIEFCYLTL